MSLQQSPYTTLPDPFSAQSLLDLLEANKQSLTDYCAAVDSEITALQQTSGGSGSSLLSTQVVYLSAAGVLSDSDISQGSTTYGIDQTAKIQSILDSNKTNGKPLCVIFDVKASVKGLKICSNTSLIGLNGGGLILLPGSNKAAIESYGTTTKVRDKNISITNLTINCNGIASDGTYLQTHDNAQEGWVVGVRIFHADNVSIQYSRVYTAATFQTQLADINKLDIIGSTFDAGPVEKTNTDGIHLNGGCTNVTIRDNYIRGYDDHIAINANDGFGYDPDLVNIKLPVYGSSQTNWLNGPITNVYCENNTFLGGELGLRILSVDMAVDNIIVKDTKGQTAQYGAVIDNFHAAPTHVSANGGTGKVGLVVINGWYVTRITGGVQQPTQAEFIVACNFDNLQIRNIDRNNHYSHDNIPTLIIKDCVGKFFEFSNYTYQFPVSVNTDHVVLNNATIKSGLFTNIRLSQPTVNDAETNLPSTFIKFLNGSSITYPQLTTGYFENITISNPANLFTSTNSVNIGSYS